MGGRGASSGVSDKENKYGTQYKTLLKSGNIKFVQAKNKNTESLLETMTKGRVYALVNEENKVSQIIYFDKNNKRNKRIDLLKEHRGMSPHTHKGYYKNEYDRNNKKGASNLIPEEKKLVERIKKLW